MKFLIFGAGALGSAIGGLLCKAGHSVALLGRPRHLDAIRAEGLKIEGRWGNHRVEGLELFHRHEGIVRRDWDYILITVKAYDTASAVAACLGLAGPHTTLVSIQNGHGNTAALCAAFGRERVLGARIITGAELEPGHVNVTVHADALRLGPPQGEADQLPHAERLASLMNDAGVPTEATDNYLAYLWAKLIYNCALNPLGALMRRTYGELVAHPPTRQVMSTIFAEAFAVCQAHGIPLFWKHPQEYAEVFDSNLVPPTAGHYPSMLRDLESRGRTEIDSMNGAVATLGAQHGIATPANEVLTAMIKHREAMHQVP